MKKPSLFLPLLSIAALLIAVCTRLTDDSGVMQRLGVSPSAPDTLSAVGTSASVIALSWPASPSADFYRIFRSDDNGTIFSLVTEVADTKYSDTGLMANTLYIYRITSVNAIGESNPSSSVQARTLKALPAAPTNLAVSAISSTALRVSWAAVANADFYNVYRTESGATSYRLIGVSTASPYLDTGLVTNTTYYYRVSAQVSSDESPLCAAVSGTTQPPPVTAPEAPRDVVASATSSANIQLTWALVQGAASYVVYRRAGAIGSFSAIASASSDSYLDTGLTPSTLYCYAISAKNVKGESPQSTAACDSTEAPPAHPPVVPQGLIATAMSSSSILLSWNLAQGATSYKVYRSNTPGGPFVEIAAPATNSYTNTGLNSSTQYFYRVSSVNSSGESPLSAEAAATTHGLPPPAPTGLSGMAISSSSIRLTWTAAVGAISYKVYRSPTSDGNYTEVGAPLAASYDDNGLSASTTYYYCVTAINAWGESPKSSPILATTNGVPPSAPTGLNATATSSTAIHLAWNAAAGATSYTLYRSQSAVGPFAPAGTSSAASFDDNGLTPATAYYYRVTATNVWGESPQSATVTATTFGVPPATPSGFSVTATSTTSIHLSWNAVTGATKYIIYRRSIQGADIALDSSTTTSYDDNGLKACTTYTYKVAAKNSFGQSDAGSPQSAITQCLPTPTAVEKSFFSPSLGKTVSYWLYRPKNYDQEAAAGRKFSVIYLLHWWLYNANGWHVSDGIRINPQLDKCIDSVTGIIAVAPQDDTEFNSQKGTSWWVDSPNTPSWKYGSLLAKDMVSHVDATYATRNARLHRGLCGVGMGGFGALHHIRVHADTFSIAYAVVPLCDLRNWDHPSCSYNLCAVFGTMNAAWDAYNPILNANGYRGKNITFAIQTGDCSAGCPGSTIGDFYRNESIAFHEALNAAGVAHTFKDLPNTGHDYPSPQQMVEILRFFAQHFSSN